VREPGRKEGRVSGTSKKSTKITEALKPTAANIEDEGDIQRNSVQKLIEKTLQEFFWGEGI